MATNLELPEFEGRTTEEGKFDVCFQFTAFTDPSGAEIVEVIDEAYPSGVNQSCIYQILQSLEWQGLADSRDVDGHSNFSTYRRITSVVSLVVYW